MTSHATPNLEIWTVYDHPTDYPDSFVARLWIGMDPTEQTIIAPSLSSIRTELTRKGKVPIPRHINDDPKIVECWV